MKKIFYPLLTTAFITATITHAETITGAGEYIFDGNTTENYACGQAEIKARQDIMEKIGNTSFSHRTLLESTDANPDGTLTKQSVEFGSVHFERIVSKTQQVNRKKAVAGSSQEYNVCAVALQAEVKPFKTKADPNFSFVVTLPRTQYYDGDLLEFDITPSKSMYMTVFLWQPDSSGAEYIKISDFGKPISEKTTLPDGNRQWKLVSESVGNTTDLDTLYILATKQPLEALASYTFQDFNTLLFKIERENWDLKTISYTVSK